MNPHTALTFTDLHLGQFKSSARFTTMA